MTMVRSFSLALALTATLPAIAQPVSGIPLSAMRSMAIPGAPAKVAYAQKPDGSRDQVPHATVRFKTEVAKDSETLESLFRRNNLVMDEATLTMLRSLNPEIDTTKPVLQGGKKIDILSVVPDRDSEPEQVRYTFDSPNFVRMGFTSKSRQASENFKVAKEMPASAFSNVELRQRHLQSLEKVENASRLLEAKADHLSRFDFAVAQYQIEAANTQAAKVNRKVAAGTISETDLAKLNENVAAVETSATRASNGQPVAGRRLVTVKVFRQNTDQHVNDLAVYIVPGGMVGSEDYPQSLVEWALMQFSFTNPTSPVGQEVSTDFNAWACIGPKNAVAAMAQHIRTTSARTCRRLNFPTTGELVVTFKSPMDVTKP